MKKIYLFLLSILLPGTLLCQDYRWQQRVEYVMDVHLDVNSHLFTGTQKLTYYNNSSDTLTKVYYHLYFNAFQPGSMMDVRSRNIQDPNPIVTDRIYKLKDSEIGYQHIESLSQDGKALTWKVDGTILEVPLNKPLLPKSKAVFQMSFNGQVPLQIRRSGRDNAEGIAYSMTQWYPEMAEYDYRGWHADQYVGREFHGVWGDYDVTLRLDPTFIVAGSGVLQNPEQVGYGYEDPGTKVKRPEGDLVWHFIAKNVHDFAWAADPDYVHDKVQVPGGPELQFFYQDKKDEWKEMIDYAVRHFEYMKKVYGPYPYSTYSIIQGGDGGMEYPMCTLITGIRSLPSLVGVMTHETAHSWFQGVLASNETEYPWMDEGFTEFVSIESFSILMNQDNPHEPAYKAYKRLVESGLQEPVNQQSDYFTTNFAYSVAAYSMGELFLEQLKYIMGPDAFYQGMHNYYSEWKFRHPEPNDFLRVMEKTSGLQLRWFMTYWINTTKTIDYGIKSVVGNATSTYVTLQRLGELPMPVDVEVNFSDSTKALYNIPLNEMLGAKQLDTTKMKAYTLTAWPWVNPTYTFEINVPAGKIVSVKIDPDHMTADINRDNNDIFPDALKPYVDPTR